MHSSTSSKSYKWLWLSFLFGFVIAGSAGGCLTWLNETDKHHQHSSNDDAFKDAIESALIFGFPAGLSAILGIGVFRWSIRTGWWRAGGPEIH